jgi:hypothetical protein
VTIGIVAIIYSGQFREILGPQVFLVMNLALKKAINVKISKGRSIVGLLEALSKFCKRRRPK